MIIQGSVSVGAGVTNNNVIAGSQFEFLPRNCLVEFGLVASATGLLLDISSGGDLLGQSYTPSTQNRVPIYPDDFTLVDVGLAGERIVVKAYNPTGGALTLFYSIRITPV